MALSLWTHATNEIFIVIGKGSGICICVAVLHLHPLQLVVVDEEEDGSLPSPKPKANFDSCCHAKTKSCCRYQLSVISHQPLKRQSDADVESSISMTNLALHLHHLLHVLIRLQLHDMFIEVTRVVEHDHDHTPKSKQDDAHECWACAGVGVVRR